MSFSKLPPDVRRELLRHVKPRGAAAGANRTSQSSGSSSGILFAYLGLLGCAGMIPYVATQWIGNLNEKDDALTPAQVRRGAFLNSGTKDAGKDPNWDFRTGTYKYPPGFAEHLKMQNPKETDLGPTLGPMVRQPMQNKSEK